MKHPYHPRGCDQQGRHPELAERVDDQPEIEYWSNLKSDLFVAFAIIAAVALLGLAVSAIE